MRRLSLEVLLRSLSLPRLRPLLALPVLAMCKPASAKSEAGIPLPPSAPAPSVSDPVPVAADTVRLTGLTGTFHAVRSPRPHGEQFELSLYSGSGAGQARRRRVGFARYGAGRPEVGRYSLGLLNRENPGGRFYAAYHTTSGDTSRAYVSVEGELVITASSPERVAGRFRFRGAEYSASFPPAGRRGSGSPSSVAADAPTVEVVGTFTSTRLNEREMVACVGTGGPSVMVEVRDPQGHPAAFGTTIVIQEGAFRDSVDGTRRPMGPLHVGAGERRPGTYQVRLYKPGYKPVVLHNVRAPGDERCKNAEPTDIRRVTLELLPNAPPVRSIIVMPPGMGLGIPGYETSMRAIVDAAPGVSQVVRWTSSDTTVATISPSGLLRSQCRRTPGEATITATSVADPRLRGTASVTVYAMRPGDERGLAPPSARAKAEACLARLDKPD